jgi:hypothetical protein
MSIEEFNALPLEARRFIENHVGCMGCGDKTSKLSNAYKLYLNSKKMSVYQLKGGGVNYSKNGKDGILYPLIKEDSDEEIRLKLSLAKDIFKVRPTAFISFDLEAIKDLENKLQPVDVVVIPKAKKYKKHK